MTPAQEFYADLDRQNARFFSHLERCRDESDLQRMAAVCRDNRRNQRAEARRVDDLLAQHMRASRGRQ